MLARMTAACRLIFPRDDDFSSAGKLAVKPLGAVAPRAGQPAALLRKGYLHGGALAVIRDGEG